MTTLSSDTHFSGSYLPNDVQFLLQPTQTQTISIAQKEQMIGRGIHYGHLLSREEAPSAIYQQLFTDALERNGQLMARHIVALAYELIRQEKSVLVSLARGGTPIGVLLKRTIEYLGHSVWHYSVSIIRDHGIDPEALRQICQQHRGSQIAFIDGWTGKGVINSSLKASVKAFNQSHHENISSDLFVLCDPIGIADTAATHHDYLLPNAMLNATVSGLISRTILSQAGFHQVMLLEDLQTNDVSRFFVDSIMEIVRQALKEPRQAVVHASSQRQALCQKTLGEISKRFNLSLNHVKPSIGEATRVLLRRQPEALILQKSTLDTKHLENLAAQTCPVIFESSLPYAAIALIKGQPDHQGEI